MILLKCIFGGLAAVVLVWVLIVAAYVVQLKRAVEQQGVSGQLAVAGGWNYLLHKPLTAVLLGAAFGLGVFLTAKLMA